MSQDGQVRLLPTDPRDMTPPAVWWAKQVLVAIKAMPRAELQAPSRASLTAVVWTLAAAADWTCTVAADLPAAVLAREAGVGDRGWQKRTAWLRQREFSQRGRLGLKDGWQQVTPQETVQ